MSFKLGLSRAINAGIKFHQTNRYIEQRKNIKDYFWKHANNP